MKSKIKQVIINWLISFNCCTEIYRVSMLQEASSTYLPNSSVRLSSDSQSGSVEFIEKQSTLVITSKLLAKCVTWKIQLERIETTTDVKCEFLVKQVEQLTSRLSHLEELLGVGKDVQHPVFAEFGNYPCTLSDDRRKLTVLKNYGGRWQEFLSEQPLSSMGHKFQISLDVLEDHSSVMIGVAKRNTPTNAGVYSKAGSWMLCLSSTLMQMQTADCRTPDRTAATLTSITVTAPAPISAKELLSPQWQSSGGEARTRYKAALVRAQRRASLLDRSSRRN